MKINTKLGSVLLLFMSISSPTNSENVNRTPEEEIRDLRLENKTTLKYIEFKTKYGNYERYYREHYLVDEE